MEISGVFFFLCQQLENVVTVLFRCKNKYLSSPDEVNGKNGFGHYLSPM